MAELQTDIQDAPPGTAKPSNAGAHIDPPRTTHFDFRHAVFKAPGARFLSKGQQKVPAFQVDMGGMRGLVEIAALKKEFQIPLQSHDDKLIDLAVAGLRYVPDIKPGDTIPSEILTGQASWTVSAKHRKIAEQRLQVQLLSWVSGKEVLLTDPAEIEMFLEQIENREKLRQAFRNAAEALGYKPENSEAVIAQLELLARELCYIEALRDRYAMIPRIGEKLAELARSIGNDRSAKMEFARVRDLLRMGIAEYTAIFAELDAQTGEVIAAIKSVERQISYIRKVRDELHFLIMEWGPHIANIPRWRALRALETDRVYSDLYRFLAPRFSTGRSIMTRRGEARAGLEGGEKARKSDGRSTRSIP